MNEHAHLFPGVFSTLLPNELLIDICKQLHQAGECTHRQANCHMREPGKGQMPEQEQETLLKVAFVCCCGAVVCCCMLLQGCCLSDGCMYFSGRCAIAASKGLLEAVKVAKAMGCFDNVILGISAGGDVYEDRHGLIVMSVIDAVHLHSVAVTCAQPYSGSLVESSSTWSHCQ